MAKLSCRSTCCKINLIVIENRGTAFVITVVHRRVQERFVLHLLPVGSIIRLLSVALQFLIFNISSKQFKSIESRFRRCTEHLMARLLLNLVLPLSNRNIYTVFLCLRLNVTTDVLYLLLLSYWSLMHPATALVIGLDVVHRDDLHLCTCRRLLIA